MTTDKPGCFCHDSYSSLLWQTECHPNWWQSSFSRTNEAHWDWPPVHHHYLVGTLSLPYIVSTKRLQISSQMRTPSPTSSSYLMNSRFQSYTSYLVHILYIICPCVGFTLYNCLYTLGHYPNQIELIFILFDLFSLLCLIQLWLMWPRVSFTVNQWVNRQFRKPKGIIQIFRFWQKSLINVSIVSAYWCTQYWQLTIAHQYQTSNIN